MSFFGGLVTLVFLLQFFLVLSFLTVPFGPGNAMQVLASTQENSHMWHFLGATSVAGVLFTLRRVFGQLRTQN